MGWRPPATICKYGLWIESLGLSPARFNLETCRPSSVVKDLQQNMIHLVIFQAQTFDGVHRLGLPTLSFSAFSAKNYEQKSTFCNEIYRHSAISLLKT